MNLKNFVSGTSFLIAFWLAASFISTVPSDSYLNTGNSGSVSTATIPSTDAEAIGIAEPGAIVSIAFSR